MDKRKKIRLILVIMFIVFIGLAINEYLQYYRSDQIYDEARETYYREKESSIEAEDTENLSNEDTLTDEYVKNKNDSMDNNVESNDSNISDEYINEEVEENEEGPKEEPSNVETVENTISNEEKQSVSETGNSVGWISIKGTNIDYPVVQTTDNEFYLDHNYLGNKDVKGSIYMDYRNDEIGEDRNYIIYGHKMIDGSMFSDLTYYVQDGSYKNYFNNYNIIKYDNNGEEIEWKIFSTYVVDLNKEEYYLYTNYNDDEKFQEFIDRAYSRSLLDSDIEVTLEDEIMTLSLIHI